MPTENRSSNTEMVSVPRHWAQQTVSAGPGECVSKSDIALLSKALADPAQQPHPDPIAWMVGTAFWWTKEEAERDAAETGLAIVGLGPMADAAPAELERQRSRADTNALNHKHAKNSLGDIKAFVGRLVAASAGQASVATGYLSDIADFIDRRTSGDPVYIGDANALRLDLQESRRSEFNASAEVERLKSRIETQRESIRSHVQEVDRLRVLEIKYGLKIEERNELLRKCLEWITSARDGVLYPIARDFEGVVGRNTEGLGQETPALIDAIDEVLSASAETSAPHDCAICRDLGNQCMECEEGEFREWADRHFAAADYRKTDAGVFIQDWMRHAYGAWCARGALTSKQ